MASSKKRQWAVLIAISMMYFFAPEFGAISPTLALMPDYYGIAPSQASWISALANPSACIAGLLVGAFVGRKLSYKACAAGATLLYAIFGGLPFLWQTIPFEMLLVSRALFGLGCGCLAPLSQAIVTHLFESETARSAWIGFLNVIFSIGASVGSIITGALAASGTWQNAYAFYLLSFIPFLLIIAFFRDSDIQGDTPTHSEQQTEKRSLPGIALSFIATFTLVTVLTQTFFNYAGIAMAESGCNTLLIGTVFTVFTVFSIVVAAANAALWKAFRQWNFPMAFLLIAAGYILCLVGYGSGWIGWFFAASIVMGTGCCLAGMTMPMVMSITCSASSLTLAIGLQEVARNLGSFLSAPWLNAIGSIFQDTAVVQFSATLILATVATSIAFILAKISSRTIKHSQNQNTPTAE